MAALLAWALCDLQYSMGAVAATAVPLGLAMWLLGPAVRNHWWGTAVITGAASLLLVGNAVKIGMLHTPLSIADVQALPVLLSTLSGHTLLLAMALITLAALLALASLRPRWVTLGLLAATASAAVLLAAAAGTVRSASELLLPVALQEQKMPNGEIVRVPGRQDQLSLLRARGPLLYLLEDWRLMREDSRGVPTAAEINALSLQAWHPGRIEVRRNVHIVLLESVWDISLLDHYHSNRSPFDPRFQALWERAGRPYVLSPEMGGATANAEFEVLCGLPAPRNSVAFVNLMRNPSPCLPAVLARAGYRSVASHAHQADNWNRISAYDQAGFDLYRPISAFDLDDLEGDLLADSSFFRQNLQYLDENPTTQPRLNYLVSLSSHWGFVRNTERRPDLVSISPDNAPRLRDYANAVAYTTRAFMDWAEAIVARDPDALIVAFGDHSPSLDVDPDPYIAVNGKDPASFDNAETRRKVGISRTPLLIIDGSRGAVRTGTDLPMYELPGLIGQLLGSSALLPQSAQRGVMTLRPFRGHLLASDDGSWSDCASRESAPRTSACNAAWQQFDSLRALRQDIVLGQGHYLRAQHATDYRTPRLQAMAIDERHAACEFEADLDGWGPRQAVQGQGVNVQPDGSSAMWFPMKHLRGTPQVLIGSTPAVVTTVEGLITAAFPTPALATLSGRVPVTLACPGQTAVEIGVLDLQPPAPVPGMVEDCSFSVEAWGPKTGTAGQGFNLQSDGSSGLWISMKHLRGQPRVYLGQTVGTSSYGSALVTSAFSDPGLFAGAKALPVSVACPGQRAIELGTIEMTSAR
ncbi:LTA synthase family protein [Stenotrophomonas sp. NA06056]|uniref:LTA synthase family protein n=1 Tax=Stenotrophomonas sp. NA06056 TaxID=2742129 RepID=UPI00158B0246|nr:LTA synthase family protein [Stenotrophomonas sp. NA06056]QKW58178.1 LTA synthase family protein [Stenotrophomonas sp. NA06056]